MTIYVNVKGRAIFSTKQENKDLLEKNTIAIMFPYIRSYISSITTQPGMTPIVLPAMNIVAMINDQKTRGKELAIISHRMILNKYSLFCVYLLLIILGGCFSAATIVPLLNLST